MTLIMVIVRLVKFVVFGYCGARRHPFRIRLSLIKDTPLR